jgi:uncharacterized protein (TIGR02145 family)
MNLLENTKLLWFAEAGRKERESTIYKFLTKGHDASFKKVGGDWIANGNDLVQTTELNQPYLRGNIAPNEVLCAYNGGHEIKYLEHSEISFSDSNAWSITMAILWNGGLTTTILLPNSTDGLLLKSGNNSNLYWREQDSLSYKNLLDNSSFIIGSISIITLIANGEGQLSVYINGIVKNTIAAITNSNFSKLFFNSANYSFFGKYFYHRIQSGAMTAEQVAAEAAMIRTWLPEVESVQIGEQEWATSNLDIVCTPMGTVIPEVTDNAEWTALTTPAWSYYNNDPANGAIYGKLYNWYAVEKIQQDIDAYNLANPTTPWGWRIPSESDYNALFTELGGMSIAGGKMKLSGTDYWNTPNTGADNTSGFSSLPCGGRYFGDGSFALLKLRSLFWGVTSNIPYVIMNSDVIVTTTVLFWPNSNKIGASIRLIKQ